MGSEGALWVCLRDRLKGLPRTHFVRVEDSLGSGFPDVSWASSGVEGILELKHRDDWPARPGTPVKFRHLSEDQVLWLSDRGRAGGNAKLLAQIARDYFLFDWPAVSLIYRGLARTGFERVAIAHWRPYLPDGKKIVQTLSRTMFR